MIVKRLLQGILLCMVAAQVVHAQWTARLELNNPSPFLSDWSSNRNTAILHVINTGPTRNVKILADIEHNGELVAHTNPDKVLVQTISTGQRDFFGESIVPLSAMHFEDNIDQSTQRAGRIPDGSICVLAKVVDAVTLELLAEHRQCATILSYTTPYLLLPQNEAVLCKLGENNVIEMNSGNPRPMFRWTPIVPAPSELVHYRFAIFEVLPGQYPITALRSGRPVFDRDMPGMTELIWPVEYFYPEAGKRYIWSVRALDGFGRPLMSYQDGWATPFFFTVTDECREGGVDIDGDLIPDIDRAGAPIKISPKIEVRITAPSAMPLDPDKPHEFTGRARSSTGGPFNFSWYLREVGTSMYVPLKKQPQSSNLYLAPGATKPDRTYLLKLVAEKNGAWGWHEITFTTGASSEDSSGARNGPGESSSKTWDEGASQAEVAAFFSRAYVAGRFAFILDGADAGWLHTADAGNITAGLSMQFGPGMSKPVYDWIQSSWNRKHSRRNGAIVACDFDYSVRNYLEFSDALITAIQMPALDAAAKDPCYITTSFKPVQVKLVLPDSLKSFRLPDVRSHKLWTPANFRLKIDGLEEACSKVNKVEALTIKQKVTENTVGEMRDYNKEPASVEVPNLVITLPESQTKDFYKWYENALKGTAPGLKNGTLEYQAADKSPLVTLTFKNLGIFKLTPDATSASKQVTVEMYCEQVTLNYSPDIIK